MFESVNLQLHGDEDFVLCPNDPQGSWHGPCQTSRKQVGLRCAQSTINGLKTVYLVAGALLHGEDLVLFLSY